MEIGLIFLSLGISFLIGYLLIRPWLAGHSFEPLLLVFLAAGLGLGLSSQIIFYTLIIFGQLNKFWVIAVHVLLLAFLIIQNYQASKRNKISLFFKGKMVPADLLWMGLLGVVFVPIIIYVQLYPMGGWDAWSVWNLKAKFIFSGEERWKNMLDPIMWRSSPHYPLLLPLINVCGWIFLSSPATAGPLIVSVLFTLLTVGALIFGLKPRAGFAAATLGGLLLLTLPYFVQLATSQ